MKTRYIIYMVSALALATVSCQQGDLGTDISSNGQMLFKVNTPSAHTRVANGTFEVQDKVGLYVTDYVAVDTPAPLQISGNRANNEAMVYNGTAWATERPIYWGAYRSDVYAYYPYMDIVDIEEQPFSIATDQSVEGAYESSDFLWAKASGVSRTQGYVWLPMRHAMSRIVVKIMAGKGYVGSLPADATVHLHSTVTDAHISLEEGVVVKDPYAGAKSIKMHNLGIRTFAEGDAVVYEAIVVPQMLRTKVPMFEINTKSVSYLLEDSFHFVPGVSYTYTAVLNASTSSIKVDIGCTTDDWNNIGGVGDDDDDSENEGVDLSQYTDLSAEGTANCYLIKSAGNYKFRSVVGTTDYTVGNVQSVHVLWETFGTNFMPDIGELIANVGFQNGYVYFSTPEVFKNGNASIAVCNSKGLILWSWHIWCSEEGWNDQVYPNNAGTMMDRNLGATSATPGDIGALGLFYQWGRKDPFMGSCATSGSKFAASTGSWNMTEISVSCSMDFAEENPTTFCQNPSWRSRIDATWRTSDSKKGVYDPCPVGYRVPDGGIDGFWETAIMGVTNDSTNSGIYCTLADGSSAWYPAAGYHHYNHRGLSNSVGIYGYYWSASEYGYMYFTEDGYVEPSRETKLAYGYAVRCIKDTTPAPKLEPEPDPTLIYTDLSAEGTANCYLVKTAGNYKFKTVQGNSDILIGDVAAVRVLWESFGTNVMPNVGDLIAEASYKDGYVYFSTPEILKNGNASIAVRDSTGLILWSWHIWCSEEGWNDHVYANDAGTMMDRNLGALSATPGDVGALGLLYQWGRRDPFMGSSSLTESISAISTGCWRIPVALSKEEELNNPMKWDTNWSSKEWNTSDSKKSLYDPCPVGYRVPDGGTSGFWAVDLGTYSTTTINTALISDFGCYWALDDGSTAWYPAAGRRKGGEEGYRGELGSVGLIGCFWTASSYIENTSSSKAYYMSFNGGTVYQGTRDRGQGCSVRCLKE